MRLNKPKAAIRYLKEMVEVIFDQDWLKKADPETELYYVWRGVAENEQDKEKINRAGLRYDITEFAPLTLGLEFNKTFGHIHSLVPGTNLTYPEIYEVLEGQVYFLFQKMDVYDIQRDVRMTSFRMSSTRPGSDDSRNQMDDSRNQMDDSRNRMNRMDDTRKGVIKDIFTVHCQTGDKYIIQPGYAHITINPTVQKTVLANWLALASRQSYQEIKQMKGAGYYGIKAGNEIKWIKNQTYTSVPPLKFLNPNNLLSQFGLSKDQPIYDLVKHLEKLDFLKNPQRYSWD